MKIAYIAPKSMAKYTIIGDFHFIVPQNIATFYKVSKKFKMLDNGAYEGGAIDFDDLLMMAEGLHVDEIVIPDVIKDKDATLKNVHVLIKKVPDEFKIAVVPQGKTVAEFLECFHKLSKMPNVDTICFPKWLGPLRPMVIHYLHKNERLSYRFNYHLMGLDNPLELYTYEGLGIRSVDTSMPFTYAYHYKVIDIFNVQELTRVSMSTSPFTAVQFKYLERNFKVLNDVIKHV